MGRPVWTASNHFTTISPGGRARDGVGGEERPWCFRQDRAKHLLLFALSCAQAWPLLGFG